MNLVKIPALFRTALRFWTPILLWIGALTTSAQAFEQLRNDGVVAGAEIAFYPRLQGEESFTVVLDGPERHAVYRICRLLVWIGPDDFNVFTIRINDGDDPAPANLIWQSDLNAYQIFGSRDTISAIDLRDERIFTDVTSLSVRMTHVPGADAPPTIASDTDGIQAMRNQVRVLMRNGRYETSWTEDLQVDGFPQRPPGDWILRVDVVGEDEMCPGPDDGPVPMDMGLAPDMGGDDALDMGVATPDATTIVDARLPRDATPRDATPRDAAQRDAARVDPIDAGPERDRGGRDLGDRLGAFAIERIVPAGGAPALNVDVVINGRGFPFGEPVTARLGEIRLLEATVRADSTISAIVPAGMTAGVYPLSVTRSDGQEAILPSAYTVYGSADLDLVSVLPAVVVEGQTETLSFIGAGFDGDTQFFVETVELNDVAVTGPTSATAVLDVPLVAGTYDVLAVRGETSAIMRDALSVQRPSSDLSDDCGCRVGRDERSPWTWVMLGLFAIARLSRRRCN